ncbi:MAG: hypothetical protein JWO80_6465 [Bryobacterales bacterium]|nr:hypothetical protein [Bryobacterales bacterium]
MTRRVPPHVSGAMRALNLSCPRPELLAALTAAEWQDALRWSDRAHLTLEIARRFRGALPAAVEERLASNLANNAVRMGKLERDFGEIEAAFQCESVEFVVLKGFAHWPDVGGASLCRAQYDIDLYCPPPQLATARRALDRLGYRPISGYEKVPIDHLPAMVRPSEWKWRGDYFDTEFPVMVDLHFRLWDAGTERIRVKGTEAFWERRTRGGRDAFCFPALASVDLIAYASLHLLRHLLRGDLRPFHVYDIAWFLHTHAADEKFWAQWEGTHDESARRLQLIVFLLAQNWFGCCLPEAVRSGIAILPRSIQRWFEFYSSAPLETEFHPNKSELWLHLSLLENARDRGSVFLRRVMPSRLPPTVGARSWPYWRRAFARSLHHLRALIPMCLEGLRFGFSLQNSKNSPPVIR